jgi:two-component system sensor histidine kinase PilS (NtrC family)
VDLLKWLYMGRLTLVSGILVAGLVTWFQSSAADTLFVIMLFLVTFGVTGFSFWGTHVQRREATENFLYAQVIFDALLITGIVHLTGGPTSGFASLYVLVISAGALLLPLAGGLLTGALSSLLYAADLILGFEEPVTALFGLRIVLFAVVAIFTALIGDRLRRAGQALGAVASELRQLRLDTDDILANLSTGVITVDGDGHLAYANRAAEGLLRVRLQPLLGHPILDRLDEIAPTLGGMLQQAIHRGTSVSRGQVEIRTDESVTRLGVSTAVLEREGDQMPSATALFQDITDLQRLDQLKMRAERLEAVATLSASLAHEIKNPLASIRSAVEQLSRGRLSDVDKGILERLVLTESDRLSRLLSEFLDYSGLAMSKREQVDMHALVRGCLIVAKQHPELKGVEVVATLDDGPIYVVGDGDLLHRALFNLVLNGAQSAGAGGRVSVSLTSEPDRRRPRGASIERPVRLSVGDSGEGISEEERARVFDPFFTTKAGGSGLGLAVVHRAVEAHAGVTFVDESPDGGAEFVIFLPGVPEVAAAETVGA